MCLEESIRDRNSFVQPDGVAAAVPTVRSCFGPACGNSMKGGRVRRSGRGVMHGMSLRVFSRLSRKNRFYVRTSMLGPVYPPP